MAAENIDNTVSGSGLFNTKVPSLSDAADIQAALRLYHYGSYTYDGSNTKHLQALVDADTTLNSSKVSKSGDTMSGILTLSGAPTSNLHAATKLYVDTADISLQTQITNLSATVGVQTTVTTKTNSFTLIPEDAGKTILLASSIAGSPIPGDPNPPITMTLTVPVNAGIAIPVGYQYNLIQLNYGRTIFTPELGVTINSKNGQMWIDTQYGKATLVKVDTNSWVTEIFMKM